MIDSEDVVEQRLRQASNHLAASAPPPPEISTTAGTSRNGSGLALRLGAAAAVIAVVIGLLAVIGRDDPSIEVSTGAQSPASIPEELHRTFPGAIAPRTSDGFQIVLPDGASVTLAVEDVPNEALAIVRPTFPNTTTLRDPIRLPAAEAVSLRCLCEPTPSETWTNAAGLSAATWPGRAPGPSYATVEADGWTMLLSGTAEETRSEADALAFEADDLRFLLIDGARGAQVTIVDPDTSEHLASAHISLRCTAGHTCHANYGLLIEEGDDRRGEPLPEMRLEVPHG